jgi:hypothetical protein
MTPDAAGLKRSRRLRSPSRGDAHTMTLIGILVLIAIIWLLVVLIGGLPAWLLLLLIVLVIVWFVGGRGRAV